MSFEPYALVPPGVVTATKYVEPEITDGVTNVIEVDELTTTLVPGMITFAESGVPA